MKRSVAVASLIFAAAGCSWNDEPMLGVAQTTITTVPPLVSCIQITVAGSRTVTRGFDVIAGTSSVESMPGLPTGAVTFTGAAFGSACMLVDASSVPSWVSDPTPANLLAGQVTPVNLVMKKNASATVGVDFQDDDGGTATNGDAGPPPVIDFASVPVDMGSQPIDMVATPRDLAQTPFDLAPFGG